MRWRPRTCPSIRRSLFVFAALMRGSTLTALRPLRVSHPHAADPFRIPAPLIRYTPYGYRILKGCSRSSFPRQPHSEAATRVLHGYETRGPQTGSSIGHRRSPAGVGRQDFLMGSITVSFVRPAFSI